MFCMNYLYSTFTTRVPQAPTEDQESFQILRIAAHSDHPVRNSAEEFIFGDHVLWERDNTRSDDKGSLAPNVFAYDFTSPFASNSLLNITIKIADHDLFGADYRLYGMLDGSKVYESNIFTVASSEATVAVYVVEPRSSSSPLSFNGDFTWTMEEQQSKRKLECIYETRLELYWISTDLHEIILTGLSGIPINFLRSLLLGTKSDDKFGVRGSTDWPFVAHHVYANYSKTYDAVAGGPHFGCTGEGGLFNLKYYVQPRLPGGPWGSLQPIVNCYDQAAMVQVSGTIWGLRPCWLFQAPNGCINATYVVGVRLLCNNTFFDRTKPSSSPNVGANDRRQPFGNHAFNGFFAVLRPNRPRERIYDATGGPHAGTQTPAGYLRTTIDTTTLYRELGGRCGTVAYIKQRPGVTGTLMAPSRSINLTMSENMKKFLERCRVNNAKLYARIRWDDVGTLAKEVFGDGCEVAYQSTDIGDRLAETLWHLTDVGGVDGDVVVRVRVETRIGEYGELDFRRSAGAARENFVFALKNNQLDFGPNDEHLESLWTPAHVGECTQYAVQYAPYVAQGRILLTCGNFVIDISGGSSSAALEPVARKLLAHTTIDEPFSFNIPIVIGTWYDIPTSSRSLLDGMVSGVGSPFDVKCQLDGLITAASADAEEHGLLLSKYKITTNEADAKSMVIFTFVTRMVGTHLVNLRFQQAQTMCTSVKTIQVTVTDT